MSKALPFPPGGRDIAAVLTTTWGYRVLVRVGTALAPAAGWFNPKIRRAVRARRKAGERLLAWARDQRDHTRPLLWFHAASVGEGLQAERVLQDLRRRRPECQIVYTHFSPSAEALAQRM